MTIQQKQKTSLLSKELANVPISLNELFFQSHQFYDLHIHSCLSPCGDDDMTPGNIVGMAALKGLQVIALTDHNSCLNCPAAIIHGQTFGITVIPGMELTTSEEVHIICLFKTLKDALDWDAYVYKHLMDIPNRPAIFGKQQVLDEEDQEIRQVEKLLISATDISISDMDQRMNTYHGIWFPAHINKSSTSLLSNLGFIPPDSTFSIFELHQMKDLHQIRKEHPYLSQCKVLCNSDAHYLQDIHEAEYRL